MFKPQGEYSVTITWPNYAYVTSTDNVQALYDQECMSCLKGGEVVTE